MAIARPWAFWRRVQYGTGFLLVVFLCAGLIYYTQFYNAPQCFDGTQNGDERGVDCGGVCTRICAFDVVPPKVNWARSFRVTDGLYNAVGYVENMNDEAATDAIEYTFSLYDGEGLITTRDGVTALPKDNVYPIFEGRIDTGNRIPIKTNLTLRPTTSVWYQGDDVRGLFRVVNREIVGVDSQPRLNAELEYSGLEEIENVEIVATIFDQSRIALTTSRTIVDRFSPESRQTVVFTWPEPIAKTIRSCEIPTDVVLAIDVSGSMNNDGGTPPEPISSVKDAAISFVERLRNDDQVGIITFATEAKTSLSLTDDHIAARTVIDAIGIDPKEERGSTNTGDALRRAQALLASSDHNTDARKVIVLLTDGLATAPEEDPEAYARVAANELLDAGVEVYTIGLGSELNIDFIRSLVRDEQYSYQAVSRDQIDQIYRDITASICEDGPAIIDIIPKAFK